MFKVLWNALVYHPIFNILIVLLFLFQGHLGISIIVLTLLVRGLLWNTTKQQTAMQAGMGDMQTKLKELEEKHKDDPQMLAQESMKIMKTSGIGPLKGCLGMIVQIPIFIGLLYVIRGYAAGTISVDNIYSFIVPFAGHLVNLDNINHYFLGIDLFAKNNIYLTAIGAVFVYAQTKLTMLSQKQQPQAQPTVGPNGQALPDMQKMMGPMNLFMVFMMGTFIWSTQNGVGLYLVVTTIFSVVQYLVQNREVVKIAWLTRGVDKAKIVNKKG